MAVFTTGLGAHRGDGRAPVRGGRLRRFIRRRGADGFLAFAGADAAGLFVFVAVLAVFHAHAGEHG